MDEMEVLNYIDFGEAIYGIAKTKYYYAVFYVCEEHVGAFRKTLDFSCSTTPIPEEDAIFGTMFPEEIENISKKYTMMREKQCKKWDDFFFKNNPKISEETIRLFAEKNYTKEDIRIFLKYSVFPYDFDPSKPCRIEFIADDYYRNIVIVQVYGSSTYSKVWIYEYDGNEIKLTPKREE